MAEKDVLGLEEPGAEKENSDIRIFVNFGPKIVATGSKEALSRLNQQPESCFLRNFCLRTWAGLCGHQSQPPTY